MVALAIIFRFFFSSRRRHTRSTRDWSSDVCSSDLTGAGEPLTSQRGDSVLSAWQTKTPARLHSPTPVSVHLSPSLACSSRSEERRVGKECRSLRAPYHQTNNLTSHPTRFGLDTTLL